MNLSQRIGHCKHIKRETFVRFIQKYDEFLNFEIENSIWYMQESYNFMSIEFEDSIQTNRQRI